MVQGDLQLCQPVSWVLTLFVDLQILSGNGIPATAVRCQLVHQLILTRQSQAESGLSPVGEAQLPSLADAALDAVAGLSGLWAQRQEPFPQKAVEQLVAGGAVLAQDEDVGGGPHGTSKKLFLVTWKRDAAELAYKR